MCHGVQKQPLDVERKTPELEPNKVVDREACNFI